MNEAAAPVTVAAFDFDGTLTKRDSVVPFMRRVRGTLRLSVRLAARVGSVVPAVMRRDRDTLRAIATKVAFESVAHADVERHAAAFAATLDGDALRPDTLARLRWHLDEGHHVVIVSASYEHYVRIVADAHGVHGVVATRLEVAADGRCTGRLHGANCRAGEKVRRLDQWLEERGWSREHVTLWAYGDSSGDSALLDAADHPVWVRDPIASVPPTA